MLDKKTGQVEQEKKKALKDKMELLADEIVDKKTALKKKQIAEIAAAGLICQRINNTDLAQVPRCLLLRSPNAPSPPSYPNASPDYIDILYYLH